jgi:FdhD protein
LLAVEEPLEIRLGFAGPERWTTRSLSVTMRTPGHDVELAAGFLFTEGVICSQADIAKIEESPRPEANIIRVDLMPEVRFHPRLMERNFYTTSSCGVCGKASLEAVAAQGCECLPHDSLLVSATAIHRLPAALQEVQNVFNQTGGLHAACLFSAEGELIAMREDVGRHNALDKLIGASLLAGKVPLSQSMLLVSGRASFELVQKAIRGGIPLLAAVGAPSSLAVELAREFDMTLLGFVRHQRFNIYSGEWRIRYETTNQT